MSTGTMTTATSALQSSPSSIHLPSEPPAAATLRALYPRAAKAFLHRDFALTHSLLVAAFDLLIPPTSPEPDALDPHRKKWDVLRITLDITLRAAPPTEAEALPAALRANALLSAPALLASLYTRSLKLFTPPPHNVNAMYLPAQILLTLALAALKLDAPQDARAIIEDWLACRMGGDLDGYAKVLEIYCAHVLARLDDWDYARDFLRYERELPEDKKQNILQLVDASHEQTLAARRQAVSAPPTPPPSSPTAPPQSGDAGSSRATSPSPSTVSSTSTVRPNIAGGLKPLSTLAPVASTSSSPAPTVRARRRPSPSAARATPLPPTLLPTAPPVPAHPAQPPPSTLALLQTTLRVRLASLGRARALALLLAVLLPLLSFLLRLRRAAPRKRELGAAADVRRRLAGATASGGGVLGSVWSELVRAVIDAVTMAGRGLV